MRAKVTGLGPTGGPYSHGIVVSGRLLFLAGQIGRDPTSGDAPDDIFEQTQVALANMQTVIESAGASLSDVVRILVFLSPGTDRKRFNDAYRQHFAQEAPPVRTTVEAKLAPGLLVEMEAIAVVPD